MRTFVSGPSLLILAVGGCLGIGIGLDQWRQGLCVEGCDTVITGAHSAYADAILPPLYIAMLVVFVLACVAVRRQDGYRSAVTALFLSLFPAMAGLIVIAAWLVSLAAALFP